MLFLQKLILVHEYLLSFEYLVKIAAACILLSILVYRCLHFMK